MARLTIIGGGNMGAALLEGLLGSGQAADELTVVEVVASRRDELGARFPGVRVLGALDGCPASVDGAVVAVKPGDVVEACRSAVRAGARRVLSIAAGVRLATLDAACGDGVAVLRAMPNTPALVRQGASALAGGASVGEDDLGWAEQVLGAVGIVVRVPEHQLDAVTGLAGSGPAYLFLVAEALIEAGVAEGLSRPVVQRLVRQLFVGSAALLDQESADAGALRAMVTSPGGTTAAGLAALEERAVRAAFAAAVQAATERSRELG